jgi:hypothetical protein
MVVYVDQLFNIAAGSATALTAMNSGTTAAAGTYPPQLDGGLIKVGVFATPSAATSLAQRARVELSNTNWKPNVLRFPIAGYGLATAPQAIGGSELLFEFVVDQPVKTSWAITGNYILFNSPVTADLIVYGYFSA